MKARTAIILSLSLIVGALVATACGSNKSACSPEAPKAPLPYVTPMPTRVTQNDPETYILPAIIEIKGKQIAVDKVVHDVFCDDQWSGKVFVDCDIEVAEWEEVPNFLDGCSLSIAEGTVVYVASHNNQAYYKGCSCHYTDEKFPEMSGP
jgi:hypothetical protein